VTARIKGSNLTLLDFPGYLISDEYHQRGQIVLSLKQAGHYLDKKILYGILGVGRALEQLSAHSSPSKHFD
jgi:hypothetical protein